ncbi:MAG: hypothetical protein GX444_17990 [Myxococcales bacterium]|nr:hypothetical protein [Myxococcales bacterium]
MDQRHQEYLEYYRVRLQKFEGNPLFPRSEAAERAMFEAIRDAVDLAAFGKRVLGEHLHVNCAVAYVYDTSKAWADLYLSIKEPVRAKPFQEILAALDAKEFTDVNELNSMASDIQTRWNIPISMDELLRNTFWPGWTVLENLEVWAAAEVPAAWRAERDGWIAEQNLEGKKLWRENTLAEARKFDPNYCPNWDLLWEERHRRLIPVADEHLRRRIAEYRQYVGEE